MSESPDIPPGLTQADMNDLERYTHDDDLCEHKHVIRDDDGLMRHWWWCLDCDMEVRHGEEDGEWVVVE